MAQNNGDSGHVDNRLILLAASELKAIGNYIDNLYGNRHRLQNGDLPQDNEGELWEQLMIHCSQGFLAVIQILMNLEIFCLR